MTTQELPDPVFGVNPVPGEGWTDTLTLYERRYVEAFGTRPDRAGWLADGTTHANLDWQATIILSAHSLSPTAGVSHLSEHNMMYAEARAARRRKMRRRWIGAAVLVPALAVSSVLMFLGVQNTSEIYRVEENTGQIERMLDGL